MRWIKLFESFDKSNEDYIVSSIRDILVELQDEGMEIEIDYRPEDRVTIEIKGKNVNDYPYEMHKEFEVSSIRDYVDTVIDFIEEIWPSYTLYFEKYDVDDSHLFDGEILQDGPVGLIVIQIHKREI